MRRDFLLYYRLMDGKSLNVGRNFARLDQTALGCVISVFNLSLNVPDRRRAFCPPLGKRPCLRSTRKFYVTVSVRQESAWWHLGKSPNELWITSQTRTILNFCRILLSIKQAIPLTRFPHNYYMTNKKYNNKIRINKKNDPISIDLSFVEMN